jgi:hypothetical protein
MAVDLEKLEYAADRLEAYVSEELAQTVRLAIAEIRMGDETTAIFMRQVEELRAENARLRKDLADASAAQEQASAYASDREAHIEELTAERERLVRRIRGQRAALRENWEIVEQRVGVAVTARLFKLAKARGVALRAAEARAEAAEAEIARLRDAAVCVHDTFAKDIEQGYRTKDKQFAVAVLGQALAATTLDQEN